MLVFDQEKSDHALKAAVEIRQLIHQLNLAGTYENIDIWVGNSNSWTI